MYVFSVAEGFDHRGIPTHRGDQAEFYLRVIRREQNVVLVSGHKGLADGLAAQAADGDVLKVGLVGAESPGSGRSLTVNGVYAAAVGIHLPGQGIYISRL